MFDNCSPYAYTVFSLTEQNAFYRKNLKAIYCMEVLSKAVVWVLSATKKFMNKSNSYFKSNVDILPSNSAMSKQLIRTEVMH